MIKDAAPLEARFTILEENKSYQQIIIHFKEHGDSSFSETFVCAQIWKHRADEHLTSRLQDSPDKNTNPTLDQCGWGIQACKHYSYPVSWPPEEELNSGSSGEREERRLPASVLAIAAAKNVGPIRRHRAPFPALQTCLFSKLQ